MYDRPTMDQYQDLVSQAYGSPVNPAQSTTGDIELRNPVDDKILAIVKAGADGVDPKFVVWTDGVEHDDSKITNQFRGWNAFANKTTDDGKPTPEAIANPPMGKEEAPTEEAPTEETPTEEAPTEETPTEDVILGPDGFTEILTPEEKAAAKTEQAAKDAVPTKEED